MLSALMNGTDNEVTMWTEQALKEVSEAQAQALDPVSIALMGSILIGSILAARVTKIGSVELEKDLPASLGDVLKAAFSFVSPIK